MSEMTRRGFLKMLAALPVVAALPATAEIIKLEEALDVAPAPLLVPKNWLTFDGVPMLAQSISIDRQMQTIDVTDRYDVSRRALLYGIPTDTLDVKLVALPEVYLPFWKLGEDMAIEAQFGTARFSARGMLCSIAANCKVGALLTHRVKIMLREPRWQV